MPEPDEAERLRLFANVTKEQFEYVRMAAFKRRISISQFIRELIEAELRAHPNP